MQKIAFPFIALLLVFWFAVASCSKDNIGGEKTGILDTTISDTSFFIDVTIDGERTIGIAGRSLYNYYAPWFVEWDAASFDGIFSDGFSGSECSLSDLYPGNKLYHHFDFAKGNLYLHQTDLSADTLIKDSYQTVSAFFTPGNYSFSQLGGDTLLASSPEKLRLLTDGVVLQWKDENDVVWRTYASGGDQAGSRFTITASQPSGDIANDRITGDIVAATFNCKLYDGKGHVKLLTNGRFRLPLWL